MPDLLALYAQGQPDKLAVIDDRPGGDVRTMTYIELDESANRLANVLADSGVGQRTKIVWCGQNSIGVVTAIDAAAKLGATAVPLNYRLSDEEAAFVTDHSDARLVIVDAEFAPMFQRIRDRVTTVSSVLVFDGDVPDGDGLFADQRVEFVETVDRACCHGRQHAIS
ncbi:MAG: AMP-binding protein, partial [Actinomycetota bacterium]|nr:AMP-binding protein [Actinomycetota bacterium]